jgi:hypothetical protein
MSVEGDLRAADVARPVRSGNHAQGPDLHLDISSRGAYEFRLNREHAGSSATDMMLGTQ